MKELRNARWEKAFSTGCGSNTGSLVEENPKDAMNRKATIVIEHSKFNGAAAATYCFMTCALTLKPRCSVRKSFKLQTFPTPCNTGMSIASGTKTFLKSFMSPI